jgi:hypothetical protein
MRIKLIALATVVAALAIGVTASQASLQQSVSVNVKFKKAGGPGTVSVNLENLEPAGGNPDALVPERIAKLIVSSKSIAYNSKALPYCKVVPSETVGGKDEIPTNAAQNNLSHQLTPEPGASNTQTILKNCPTKSLIGKGTFEAVVGTVRQPFDPSQAGLITGKIFSYNYKPRPGDQAAFVVWIQSSNPVPNANQYSYVGVSKKGVLTASIPTRDEIPPNIASALPEGTISLTKLKLTLTAPKPPKGKKPAFTIKSFSNLDVTGQLVRD